MDSLLVLYEVLFLMILGIGLILIEVVECGEIFYWCFFKFCWWGVELLIFVVYILVFGSYFFLIL